MGGIRRSRDRRPREHKVTVRLSEAEMAATTVAAERAGLTLAAYIVRAVMDAAEHQDGPITEVQHADREKPGSPAGFRRRTPLARQRPSSLTRSANLPRSRATAEQSKSLPVASRDGFLLVSRPSPAVTSALAALLGLAPLHSLAVALFVTIALTSHSYGLMYGRASGPSGPIRGEIGADLRGCTDHFACGSGPEVVPSREQVVPGHRVSGRAAAKGRYTDHRDAAPWDQKWSQDPRLGTICRRHAVSEFSQVRRC